MHLCSVLTGLLPGLVLRILLLVMPMILAALVRRSGVRRSRGDVDAAVMTMYFIFQVTMSGRLLACSPIASSAPQSGFVEFMCLCVHLFGHMISEGCMSAFAQDYQGVKYVAQMS